jgi:hypothetical protein
VRIAYVLNETDLTKAIECLKEGLKQYAATQTGSKNLKPETV